MSQWCEKIQPGELTGVEQGLSWSLVEWMIQTDPVPSDLGALVREIEVGLEVERITNFFMAPDLYEAFNSRDHLRNRLLGWAIPVQARHSSTAEALEHKSHVWLKLLVVSH